MLAYVDTIERENTITIDGYTSNKTEKGIIRDVARAIQPYSESEAQALLDALKFGIDERQRIDRCIELEEKCKNIDLDSLHNADEDIDFFLNMVNN